MLLTAVLLPAAEGGLTAFNPETGTTTQGETVEAALASLREATELYLEEFPLAASGLPLVTTFEVEVRREAAAGLWRGRCPDARVAGVCWCPAT